MIDFIKSVRWSLLFIGVITIVIGVAMVMYPDTASDTIVKILGGIMGVSAIISILGYLIDRAKGLTSFTSLLVGAVMLIMGAVLYFKPNTFVEFLGYIFAVIVLVQGLNLIVEGLGSKKYKNSHWGQTLLMGLISVGLAVLVFINPFGSFKALMIMTGVALILAGIMNVFVSWRIGFAAHAFNKAVKAAEAEMNENAKVENLVPDSISEATQEVNADEDVVAKDAIKETLAEGEDIAEKNE